MGSTLAPSAPSPPITATSASPARHAALYADVLVIGALALARGSISRQVALRAFGVRHGRAVLRLAADLAPEARATPAPPTDAEIEAALRGDALSRPDPFEPQ